jgi:hypothetical protein
MPNKKKSTEPVIESVTPIEPVEQEDHQDERVGKDGKLPSGIHTEQTTEAVILTTLPTDEPKWRQ